MKNILKSLIILESCIICVLFLIFSLDVAALNHIFIITIALAAIEAGIGFRLLANLIRRQEGTLGYIIHSFLSFQVLLIPFLDCFFRLFYSIYRTISFQVIGPFGYSNRIFNPPACKAGEVLLFTWIWRFQSKDDMVLWQLR